MVIVIGVRDSGLVPLRVRGRNPIKVRVNDCGMIVIFAGVNVLKWRYKKCQQNGETRL